MLLSVVECNSLLQGVTAGLLKNLKSVQNAAARFITEVWKFVQITCVLRQLHWMPVPKRVVFKVATLF